jgi:hypothetical protein
MTTVVSRFLVHTPAYDHPALRNCGIGVQSNGGCRYAGHLASDLRDVSKRTTALLLLPAPGDAETMCQRAAATWDCFGVRNSSVQSHVAIALGGGVPVRLLLVRPTRDLD